MAGLSNIVSLSMANNAISSRIQCQRRPNSKRLYRINNAEMALQGRAFLRSQNHPKVELIRMCRKYDYDTF